MNKKKRFRGPPSPETLASHILYILQKSLSLHIDAMPQGPICILVGEEDKVWKYLDEGQIINTFTRNGYLYVDRHTLATHLIVSYRISASGLYNP